jgi:hypothetical protein
LESCSQPPGQRAGRPRMPNVTIRALDVTKPAASLAAWLAAHHPDLFLTAFKQAQAANMKKGIQKLGLLAMGRLADDGVTTYFGDDSSTPSFDASSAISPISFSEPGLQTVTFDPSIADVPTNLISDSTASGSNFLSSVGNSTTSAGSTVGSTLSSAGSSVLGALGSVASYLTSATGLNNLSTIAKSYFGSQAASNTAQTQQAIVQAQIARTATGATAAPVTYTTNAQGQVVPVYATQTAGGTVYQPLSAQGIASLTPPSLSVFISQYGLYLGVGAIALIALAARR